MHFRYSTAHGSPKGGGVGLNRIGVAALSCITPVVNAPSVRVLLHVVAAQWLVNGIGGGVWSLPVRVPVCVQLLPRKQGLCHRVHGYLLWCVMTAWLACCFDWVQPTVLGTMYSKSKWAGLMYIGYLLSMALRVGWWQPV